MLESNCLKNRDVGFTSNDPIVSSDYGSYSTLECLIFNFSDSDEILNRAIENLINFYASLEHDDDENDEIKENEKATLGTIFIDLFFVEIDDRLLTKFNGLFKLLSEFNLTAVTIIGLEKNNASEILQIALSFLKKENVRFFGFEMCTFSLKDLF
jgi:hypothetical protein